MKIQRQREAFAYRIAAVDPTEYGIDPDDYHFRRDLGRWKPKVGDDGMVDLYHRTSPSRADSIVAHGFDPSMADSLYRPTDEVFFSTTPNGKQKNNYGDAVVHVRVPATDVDFDTVWGEDSEEAWATAFPPDLKGLPIRRIAKPTGYPQVGLFHLPPDVVWHYRNDDTEEGRGDEKADRYHDAGRPSLKEQIQAEGITRPIEINTNGKQGYILDGHHRTDIARALKMPTVPVIINWSGDQDYGNPRAAHVEPFLQKLLTDNPGPYTNMGYDE